MSRLPGEQRTFAVRHRIVFSHRTDLLKVATIRHKKTLTFHRNVRAIKFTKKGQFRPSWVLLAAEGLGEHAC